MVQEKIYRSKISYGLLVLMAIICLVPILIPVFKGADFEVMLITSIIMIGTLSFIIHTFVSTRYWINENHELRIKAGIVNNLTIPISEIRSIKRTDSWLASPAASFDRIEIKYGKWNQVIISPLDRQGLVNEIKAINPEIVVYLRNK